MPAKLSLGLMSGAILILMSACSVGGHYGYDTSGSASYGTPGTGAAAGSSERAQEHMATQSMSTGAPSVLVAPGRLQQFEPWPPPVPTARLNLDLNAITERGKFRTVGDVSDYVTRVFKAAGYDQYSYWYAPGGFAFATSVECVEADGAPKAGGARWVPNVDPFAGDWMKNWFTAIFERPAGYYRVYVLVVTTDTSAPTDQSLASYPIVKDWAMHGRPFLPEDIKAIPLSPSYIAYVNLYEFKQVSGESPRLLSRSVADPMLELKLAGIAFGNQ
ncbi:MAG TPA: hypothetical protein VMF53_01100 [Alphaproteobacteria bacterium]|nr:hypothetical protein [Alphaproteobacteria bacterium]